MEPTETIKHLLHNRKLEKVLGVRDFKIDPSLTGKNFKIHVLSHNTPGYKVLCEDWGDEHLVHHNHYMTSFLDNIALVTFATSLAPQSFKPVGELYSALARRFFAEQIFVIKDCAMARTLFLETLLQYDEHLRPVFELRASDTRVEKSSKLFTAMVSDFFLHHELGHVLSTSQNFELYREAAIEEAKALPDYSKWDSSRQVRFLEEIEADLFSLTVAIGIYAPRASGPTLLSYLRVMLILATRMQALDASAAEAYRINVDPNFNAGDIAGRFTELAYREYVGLKHLDTFEFSEGTVVPLAQDDFLDLVYDHTAMGALVSNDLSAPITPQSRRLAETISKGFEPGASFADVIASTRQNWVLDRR